MKGRFCLTNLTCFYDRAVLSSGEATPQALWGSIGTRWSYRSFPTFVILQLYDSKSFLGSEMLWWKYPSWIGQTGYLAMSGTAVGQPRLVRFYFAFCCLEIPSLCIGRWVSVQKPQWYMCIWAVPVTTTWEHGQRAMLGQNPVPCMSSEPPAWVSGRSKTAFLVLSRSNGEWESVAEHHVWSL